MKMPKYFSQNYRSGERTFIDKRGDEILSSYRIILIAHDSSCFDNWVVLNSFDKEITLLKNIRVARGLISLSFWCGVKIVNTVEIPQYVKYTCTISHISCSYKIGREYGLQTGLLEEENSHSEITKDLYHELRHFWEPYLKSDVSCLAVIYAGLALKMQKITKLGIMNV